MSPFVLLQHCLPHHLLSRLTGRGAACRVPWFKNRLIRWFIRRYQVNMEEAVSRHPEDYEHFNAFFTRALEDGRRPIDGDEQTIVSPADGAVSAIGDIRKNSLIQAKGVHFTLDALLAGNTEKAALFRNGTFATVYLSPKDYHRVHMPLTGRLTEMTYVPGRLFSVNQLTTKQVLGLFARNERAICYFETEYGPMAVVLVGAMIVAGIETVWAGQVAPSPDGLTHSSYAAEHIEIGRGKEMGRFRLGSTAIVLFGPGMNEWQKDMLPSSSVRMGQSMGKINNGPEE